MKNDIRETMRLLRGYRIAWREWPGAPVSRGDVVYTPEVVDGVLAVLRTEAARGEYPDKEYWKEAVSPQTHVENG